jgi:multiple sugar transport system substrate-binding protein
MPAINDPERLVFEWKRGQLSRRSFITRAAKLGLSGAAISAALAHRGALAQDSPPPTQTPVIETHDSGEAEVQIRYWSILNGPDADEMNELVGMFVEENPNIAVESLQGVTDFIPKMQTAAISDTAPDIALVRHTYIAPFASRNILSPLTPEELDQAGIVAEDYDPTVWQFTGFEGQQYTIPLDIHLFSLMYSNPLLSDAGVTVPTTLDELRAVAEATTGGDNVGYMHWILNNNDPTNFTWLWFNYQHQFGGQMLNEDGTAAAFNTPEGVAALTWMKELEEIGNPEHLPYFDLNRNGQVATWPDGPWIITPMFNPEEAPAYADLDIAVMPQHDPAAPAVWAQSHQFCLPTQGDSDEARREASFYFVDWMTEHSVEWAAAGQVPAHNASREEALAREEFNYTKLQPYAEQLSIAKFMPTVPALLEALPRLGTHVIAAILGQSSVEDALSNAESEVNDILSAS